MSQSVDRALCILEELAKGPKRLGPLSETLGIHKSTVLRLIQTLETHDFVRRRDGEPEFSLGLQILALSGTILADLDVRSAARPHIERLAAETGETVHLGMLDGAEVVYLDKVESIHPVRMYSRVGARAPAYCTGVGKALLAYTSPDRWTAMEFRSFTSQTVASRTALMEDSERTRRQGYATDEREHEETIRCIAAPVFDMQGDVAAAISISVPTSRMTAEELAAYVEPLLRASAAATTELGGRANLVGPAQVRNEPY